MAIPLERALNMNPEDQVVFSRDGIRKSGFGEPDKLIKYFEACGLEDGKMYVIDSVDSSEGLEKSQDKISSPTSAYFNLRLPSTRRVVPLVSIGAIHVDSV